MKDIDLIHSAISKSIEDRAKAIIEEIYNKSMSELKIKLDKAVVEQCAIVAKNIRVKVNQDNLMGKEITVQLRIT